LLLDLPLDLLLHLFLFTERARRAQLREERAQLIAEGKEIPPELMSTPGIGFIRKRRRSDESVNANDLDEDIFMALFKGELCLSLKMFYEIIQQLKLQN
jgi:hypothetical protein